MAADYQSETTTARQCSAMTAGGDRCQAYALTGSERCFWHSPGAARDRAAARSAGGRARHGRRLEPGEPVSLKTPAEALQLLERAAGDLLSLEISVSRSRALCQVAVAAVQVWQQTELEQRVSALEESLHDRSR